MFTLHLLHIELNLTKEKESKQWTCSTFHQILELVTLSSLKRDLRISISDFTSLMVEGTGMTNTFCYSFLTANGI